MNEIDYTNLILPIIKNAGKKINENFRFKRSIDEKGSSNYVTDLDFLIENYIINNIKNVIPDAEFVSEEKVHFINSNSFWILDPIDGTTNLIHNYPSVCISLSHVINKSTVFGVVYNPISHELFFAEKGKKAFLEKNKHLREIHVSHCNQIAHSIIGFGFPYDKTKSEDLFCILKKLILECDDLKRSGPASLDLCYVACGRLDAYFELDLEQWDFSAGALILLEAGGKITDFAGQGYLFSKTNIIATNSLLHKEMMKKVNLCSR